MIKKTMHELAQEFPEKTYRELEKYRDADRQEEDQRILTQQDNEELKEDQHKENWKERYEKEHRLRQEAETKLKKEICELRQDNRKLAHEVEDRVTRMRKAGLI